MPLPNLIVIGAQKCGNTSLNHYLKLHPEISTGSLDGHSELNFFSYEEAWRRGPDWYAGCFPDAPVRAEGSPSYSEFPFGPYVPERMKALVPDVRLVYLVRDPIARMVSGWHFERCYGLEGRSFDEAFATLDDCVHVVRSMYATQLERYLAHFPEEQILVVDQRELRDERAGTLRRIFRFAGVDETFTTPLFGEELNVLESARWLTPAGRRVERLVLRVLGERATRAIGARVAARLRGLERAPEQRPRLDGPERERFVELFAPEVERLRALTGQGFESWSL